MQTPAKTLPIGAAASGKTRGSGCVKYVLMRAIIIFPFGVVTPWISAPASAIADPSDGDAKQ
jgi:hypothetical protein